MRLSVGAGSQHLLEDSMLKASYNSDLADQLSGEHGQQDKQLLARAVAGEVVKGAVGAPAGV